MMQINVVTTDLKNCTQLRGIMPLLIDTGVSIFVGQAEHRHLRFGNLIGIRIMVLNTLKKILWRMK